MSSMFRFLKCFMGTIVAIKCHNNKTSNFSPHSKLKRQLAKHPPRRSTIRTTPRFLFEKKLGKGKRFVWDPQEEQNHIISDFLFNNFNKMYLLPNLIDLIIMAVFDLSQTSNAFTVDFQEKKKSCSKRSKSKR